MKESPSQVLWAFGFAGLGICGALPRSVCGSKTPIDEGAERLRVGDCEALPVVVEIGERVTRLAHESLRPCAKLPRAVVTLASPSGVEPSVAPACGVHPRRWRGQANGLRPPARRRAGEEARTRPPRTSSGGEIRRRGGLGSTSRVRTENVVIPQKVRRQLPENRRQLGSAPQRLKARVHSLHSLHHVAQALDVRQVPAGLHGEEKVLRCSPRPALDCLHCRKAVRGRVELHSVEGLRLDLEPMGARTRPRIDDTTPVLVTPAGAADANHGMVIAANRVR